MTNIIKRQQEIDWVELRRDPKFRELRHIPEDEAVQKLEHIIGQAFQYRGQKANPTDLNYIAVNVLGECTRDRYLRTMKLPEVKDAILRGVTGRSIEMFGINVGTIVACLNTYFNDFIRGRNQQVIYRENQETLQKQTRLFEGHEAQRDHLVNQITTNFKRIN